MQRSASVKFGIGLTATVAFALLVAFGGLLSRPTMTQAQSSSPTIAQIQANPAAYYDQIVTLGGTVSMYVDDNEFLLNDGTGSIVVDPGPPWYILVNVPAGTQATVTGQIDLMANGSPDLDACRIESASGTIAIRDCSFRGPPPWAGGPNRRGGGGGRGE